MNIDYENVKSIYIHPRFAAHARRIRKHIYKKYIELNAEIYESSEPIDYSKRYALPYKKIPIGYCWGEKYGCAWFRFTSELPANIIENIDDYAAIFDIGGEGCVYDDSGVVQGITNVMGFPDRYQSYSGKKVIELNKLIPAGARNLGVYIDCGNNSAAYSPHHKVMYRKALICKIDELLLDYYYDFLILMNALYVSDDKEYCIKLTDAMNQAIKKTDKLNRSNVISARKLLSTFLHSDNKTDFTVYAVGHAHLDLAWLWPLRETKRKSERTFSNALANIEKHEDYVFGASQQQQSATELLTLLADLQKREVITQTEYDQEKQRILDKM